MYVQRWSLFNSLDDEKENEKDICLRYMVKMSIVMMENVDEWLW